MISCPVLRCNCLTNDTELQVTVATDMFTVYVCRSVWVKEKTMFNLLHVYTSRNHVSSISRYWPTWPTWPIHICRPIWAMTRWPIVCSGSMYVHCIQSLCAWRVLGSWARFVSERSPSVGKLLTRGVRAFRTHNWYALRYINSFLFSVCI